MVSTPSIRLAIAQHDCTYLPALKEALFSRHDVDQSDVYEIELSHLMNLVTQRSISSLTDCLMICVDEVTSEILRDLRSLKAIVEEPIVVFSMNFESNQALDCIRAGAIDCIEMRSASNTDLGQLMDRLRTTHPHRGGKLASVISCGGGSGATFLCKSMAQLLSQKQSVCMLDFNFYGGDLNSILVADSKHRSNNLLSHGDSVDSEMFEQSIQQIGENLYLLSSEILPPMESVFPNAELVARISEFAKQDFRISLADISIGHCHLEFSSGCDMVILVARPTIPYVYRMCYLTEQLQKSGLESSQITIVMNQLTGHHELTSREIEKMTGLRVAGQVRFDSEIANAAINTGLPLPKCKLATDIEQVVQRIFGESSIPKLVRKKKRMLPARSASMFTGLLSRASK
jgi:Flp pilus assembly CpaE family ATPase